VVAADRASRRLLDGRQAFAADATAVRQSGAAALGRVAIQKSVLPLAANLGRLVLTFHKFLILHVQPQRFGAAGNTPLHTERESIAMKVEVSRRRKWLKSARVLPVFERYTHARGNIRHLEKGTLQTLA
jgi:hypothetical protein